MNRCGSFMSQLDMWKIWQGRKDSNLRMLESKSSALTSLATPLHGLLMKHDQPITLARQPTLEGDELPDCGIF